MPYEYRSAFVYEPIDEDVAVDGEPNPLPRATAALNRWALDGWEPCAVDQRFSGDSAVATFITARRPI